jgi:hypothetical protein
MEENTPGRFPQMLRDPERQADLDRQGYVVLPFFQPEEVQSMKKYYDDFTPDMGRPFHSTLMCEDMDYRKGVHEHLKSVYERPLKEHFTEAYIPFIGSYAVKEPGGNSAWALHQDWTFTEEDKFRSVVVWSPLRDIDLDIGCLGMFAGSHDFQRTLRGRGTVSEYSEVAELIRDRYLTFIPMKAGETIVFYTSTLHYSPPNQSDAPRISATVMMIPKAARMLHYWRDPSWPEDQMEELEIDTEFLLHNDVMDQSRPEGLKSAGIVRREIKMMDEKTLRSLAQPVHPPATQASTGGWKARIQRLFGRPA